MSKEIYRKILHLFYSLSLVIVLWYFGKEVVLPWFIAIAIILPLLDYGRHHNNLLSRIFIKGERIGHGHSDDRERPRGDGFFEGFGERKPPDDPVLSGRRREIRFGT